MTTLTLTTAEPIMSLRLSSLINNIAGQHFLHFIDEPAHLNLRDCRSQFVNNLLAHARTDSHAQPTLYSQKQLAQKVRESLQNPAVRERVVPHLPQVIPKLIRSLRDPLSSPKEYKSIIEKDPYLSAAVLQQVNSAYFNPLQRRIHHIDTAIIKIGTNGLRSVICSAVMQPILQQCNTHFSRCNDKLWQHSLHCAVACQIIAKQHEQDPVKAYLLGLTHEIGTITLLGELSRQLENEDIILNNTYAFTTLVQNMSPALSYWITKDWDLPKDICNALLEQISATTGDGVSPMGYILHKANILCEVYENSYHTNPGHAHAIATALNAPDDLFDKLETVAI